MPSAATAAMSGVLLTTTLCPITWAANLPVCANSIVMVGHAADTVTVFRSNCMRSSPCNLIVQLGAAWANDAAHSSATADRMLRVYFIDDLQQGFDTKREKSWRRSRAAHGFDELRVGSAAHLLGAGQDT